MAETARRGIGGLALALGLGVVAALGQAPLSLAPAVFLGLAGAYALFDGALGLRRAALLGWLFGLGYFGLTFVWIVEPFLVDVARHGWMAPFALAFMAAGMALFWAAGFAAARALAPSGRWGWLAFTVTMAAAELARATVLTGLPWGGPGLSFVGTPLAQIGALVGAFGLSVLSFALAGGLAHAARRRHWAGFGGGLALASLALGLGLWIAAQPVPERAAAPLLRLVQPNAAQHLKWDPDHVWGFFERARSLSMTPAETPPDLVIWPETAIPSLFGMAPEIEASAAASAAPAPLVAGIRRLEGTRGFNTLAVFAPDGAPLATYDKHHVVPFGEYVPLGDLLGRLGINGLAARDGYGYSAGPGPMLLPLPEGLGTVLPLICYEAIFPREMRAAPGRADWILQITNDAWFGAFSGPQQHLAQARMRAIEFGLPFVRAANTGISAVIDARGQVLAELPLGTAGQLDALLPGALPPTLYARAGDAPMVLALMLAFAALLVLRRKSD